MRSADTSITFSESEWKITQPITKKIRKQEASKKIEYVTFNSPFWADEALVLESGQMICIKEFTEHKKMILYS